MPSTIPEIEAAALALELEAVKVPFVIDVRDAWEIERGTLPGALHMPLATLSQHMDALPDDKSTPIVTYCHHGVRSLRAAEQLVDAGYRNVRSLKGGIDAWSRAVDPSVGRY
jgi:adenylyltransferase/sulfurtransferase